MKTIKLRRRINIVDGKLGICFFIGFDDNPHYDLPIKKIGNKQFMILPNDFVKAYTGHEENCSIPLISEEEVDVEFVPTITYKIKIDKDCKRRVREFTRLVIKRLREKLKELDQRITERGLRDWLWNDTIFNINVK